MLACRTTLLTIALLALAAWRAEAQVEPSRFQVAVGGGWHGFADGSAIEGGPMVSAEATFFVTPSLGFGIWTDYTFTETDGGMFPPAALSFVDSTTFRRVNQPLDVWQYGGYGKLRLGTRVSPFLVAGAGAYTLFFDPQQANGNSNTTGLVLRFGIGVDFAVTERAGFQLAVSDAFYPNWRPGRLNPVGVDFRNSRFPELNPDPEALDGSVHSFGFAAALTLVPGI